MRQTSHTDLAVSLFDNFLRTALTPTVEAVSQAAGGMLTQAEAQAGEPSNKRTAALMRVNHVGEVCAQALYQGHALGTPNAALRQTFLQAALEEEAHLDWTAQRIHELGGRTSLLNPLWYLGAFAIGIISTRFGEARSLGFMAETERQVEAHLHSHLAEIPAEDTESRAIVERMCADEVAHAEHAQALGATALPAPVKSAMRGCAKVMTTVAHYI